MTHSRTFLFTAAILCTACGNNGKRGAGDGECVAPLLAGDVVISEIMGDPPGADAGFEWFEIYNATDAEIDLSGAIVRWRKPDGSGEDGHVINGLTIDGDSYAVAGGMLNDPAVLLDHVDYGYGDSIDFANAEGELSILCGSEEIDVVLYEEVSPDASRGFDGNRRPDAVSNDELTAWCDARTPYEEDVLGTPGETNDPCFGSAPTTCEEGGAERPTRPPMPGDVIVSEIMADPDAVGDEFGEWVEIFVTRDIDLNGLALGKIGDDPEDVVGALECIPATAGSYILFAANSDPELNGGLPPPDYPLTLKLSNDQGTAAAPSVELWWGDTSLDAVSWEASGTGKSLNLDPDFFGPELNDDPDAFCDAEREYGVGDLGTPGAPNPHCLLPTECLEGETPRLRRAPGPGDLLVTEFMAQPEAVSHGDGEWFEVRANAAFDVNGLELGEDGAVEDTIEADECIPVDAGDHIVFARNGESATNGGLPEVAGEYRFAFSNADAFFVGIGGTILDEVVWSESARGTATALDPSFTDPADNDNEGNWCAATAPYGAGDLGTPGEANPTCGGSPAGMCDDGGDLRPIVAPSGEDLVITEFMANPMVVADDQGEFIEVLVGANVDLNGLQLGRTPGDVDDTLPAGGPCISVGAGDRIVFAASDVPANNGGIDPVFAMIGFTISNGGGSLFIGVADTVLDQIMYAASVDGASTAVVPGSETTTGNDDVANFCTSGPTFGAGDRGTPGAANVCE